jgi:hypothetical protein
MTVEQVEKQLDELKNGFPFLKIQAAASIGDGIMRVDDEHREKYVREWNNYKKEGHKITKFVPASGAASRMFKNLFAFLNADYDVPSNDFEQTFFKNLKHFAFFKALSDKCKANTGKDIDALIAENDYKEVVAELLEPKGLNYGTLPKGLLQFYNYPEGPRTPMEEHLVEAALYASSKGVANIHFTVSHEHLELFKKMVEAKLPMYESRFGIKYNISFSEQKPSTDTIAANTDGTPFRNGDGTLLFRPGGHGALIDNLNEIDSDIVFIKNIDNVVPDRFKDDTVVNKQMLAGLLVNIQKKVFEYLQLLDSGSYNHEKLIEIIRFVKRTLCCRRSDIKDLEDAELVAYLKKKLNRPIRICGVVKNTGEAGGGPFLAFNHDGTVSAQILESSQIDKDNAEYLKMLTQGTHFNPVDLVCALKNYKGARFNLPDYVDYTTGFVSNKSKDGKELKALERPGLWNGAMSDWNTVCVEVPITTFNPVKTVNDLLKKS